MLIWKGLDDFDSSEANNPPKIMAGQPTPSPNPNVPPPPRKPGLIIKGFWKPVGFPK